MWIHAGPLHLAGNLLFLWIFGNAVCAKLGNLRYLLLYVLCGVVAGIVQLSFVPRPSLGASGAINGVVGMYGYGKKIKVPARFAGRFGKCPQCGSRLRIPPFSA